MMYLISGGSGSGKSEYAEKLAGTICKQESPLVYIATMHPYGQEAEKRIARHRQLRAGKGFATIECYDNLSQIVIEENATVLLECISNYLANKMFAKDKDKDKDKANWKQLARLVTEEMIELHRKVENLILVTNDIFTDGILYEEETMQYIQCLGEINRTMSQKAEQVSEVVAGIALHHKKEGTDA